MSRVPRCLTCGYFLIGIDKQPCPECGRWFDLEDPRTFSLKPPFIWWRYWLPGFALAVGLGIALFAALIFMVGFGWAASVVLPASLGAILGYGCRLPKAVLILTVLAAVVCCTLGLMSWGLLGILCGAVLTGMALVPAILGALIGMGLRKTLKGTKFAQRDYLPILLLAAIPLIAGWIEGRHHYAVESISTSIIMHVTPQEAFDAVTFYEQVHHQPPLLLRMLLPRPLHTTGGAVKVGDVKVCVYSKGKLIKRITRVEPGKLLAFEVIGQDHFENRSIRLIGGSFNFEPSPGGGTRVTLITQYQPLLGPRFWWKPSEKWATHELHDHVLLGMAMKAKDDAAAPDAGKAANGGAGSGRTEGR
jgi:hypothetical protein